MEFNRIFKFYTVFAVVIMLVITVICLGFVIVEKADANLNGAQDLLKVTIIRAVY